MKNITFDLETLGNSSNAPIVQIGAVKFNDSGEVIDTFYRNIKLKSLSKYKFEVDYPTVEWWFSQDKEAIDKVFNSEDRVDIRQALMEFKEWIGKPSEYVYWSHATFDPPILNNNLTQVGLGNFIPFRLHRDIRTLTYFSGKVEIEREGVQHDALDDCIFQAKYISEGIKLLNSN